MQFIDILHGLGVPVLRKGVAGFGNSCPKFVVL